MKSSSVTRAVVVVAVAALVFASSAFAEASVRSVLEGTGSGSVVGTVTFVGGSRALECPGTCWIETSTTLVAQLHAVPAQGSDFAGWTVPPFPYVWPPNPSYTPLLPVLEGCGTAPDCTLQVASAPDTLQPGCGGTSNCINIGHADLVVRATFVAAAAERADSTFLCYSRLPGSIPGVWPVAAAQRLLDRNRWDGGPLAAGYSVPIAMRGSEAGGTNVGAYHLTCYSGALRATGGYVNSGGDAIGAQDAAVIRADLGSELNLFPVYAGI